jgi:hypothetical protein
LKNFQNHDFCLGKTSFSVLNMVHFLCIRQGATTWSPGKCPG